jgi:hypothetical protein
MNTNTHEFSTNPGQLKSSALAESCFGFRPSSLVLIRVHSWLHRCRHFRIGMTGDLG